MSVARVFVSWAVVVLFLAYGLASCGVPVAVFWSPGALTLVLGTTLALVFLAHPWQHIWTALKTALGLTGEVEPARAGSAAKLFADASRTAIALGVLGSLMGLIALLFHLDDPQAIGPAMALALITSLYGVGLSELVFRPLAAAAARRAPGGHVASAGSPDAERFVPLVLVFLPMTAFFAMLINLG